MYGRGIITLVCPRNRFSRDLAGLDLSLLKQDSIDRKYYGTQILSEANVVKL